jgi:hypothetical protein
MVISLIINWQMWSGQPPDLDKWEALYQEHYEKAKLIVKCEFIKSDGIGRYKIVHTYRNKLDKNEFDQIIKNDFLIWGDHNQNIVRKTTCKHVIILVYYNNNIINHEIFAVDEENTINTGLNRVNIDTLR